VNPDLASLNARFAIPQYLQFSDQGPGLPVADISTPHGSARVALHGGQVLAWQPSGAAPVLWVSRAAVVKAGVPLRGGVPVCWPWFGNQPGQSAAHGLVRTRLWSLREARLDEQHRMHLRLGITDDAATRALWDHAFDLELNVTVGASLTLTLTSRNTGNQAMPITEALHTYFSVGDIHQTTVHGLDGTDYLDKVRDFALTHQNGPVAFSGETDRVYTHTSADCLIRDAAQGRTLRVAKTGSLATVVWNPWIERENAIHDLASGDHQHMLCVETANTGPHAFTLAPGEVHAMTAVISLDAQRDSV
jgi:glucose-6-phosphate 1-epimerase